MDSRFTLAFDIFLYKLGSESPTYCKTNCQRSTISSSLQEPLSSCEEPGSPDVHAHAVDVIFSMSLMWFIEKLLMQHLHLPSLEACPDTAQWCSWAAGWCSAHPANICPPFCMGWLVLHRRVFCCVLSASAMSLCGGEQAWALTDVLMLALIGHRTDSCTRRGTEYGHNRSKRSTHRTTAVHVLDRTSDVSFDYLKSFKFLEMHTSWWLLLSPVGEKSGDLETPSVCPLARVVCMITRTTSEVLHFSVHSTFICTG